ncbi:hypothetical protein D3C86_1297070 [compost metagenome]
MDLAVRQHDRVLEEVRRIADGRAGLGLELARQRLQGLLRGDFAQRMAAQAVGQHHQQGITREAVAHAVLVDTAAAFPAFLVDGESHVVVSSVRAGPAGARGRRVVI